MLMGIIKEKNYHTVELLEYRLPHRNLHFQQGHVCEPLYKLSPCSTLFYNLQGFIVDTDEMKIMVVFDHLRTKFKEVFYACKNEVIDESLMLWRGNILFRQYIPSKCHRFDLKLFIRCDCKTRFAKYLVLYTGAATEVTKDMSLGLSGAVVKTFTDPFLDNNHVLFVDNWYTSPGLVEFLLSRQTGGCGAVKRPRKNMPVVAPLANKGDVVYKQANHILSVLWTDKREVALLSTIHNTLMVRYLSTFTPSPIGGEIYLFPIVWRSESKNLP